MVGRTPWNIWRKEDILEKWILAWNTANSSHEVSNGTATLSLQWDLYASHSSNSMLASALLYCLPNKPGQAVLIQTGSFGCFTCIFSFLENSGSPSLTSEQWKQLLQLFQLFRLLLFFVWHTGTADIFAHARWHGTATSTLWSAHAFLGTKC